MEEHLVEAKKSVGTVCIKRSFEEDSLDIQDLYLSLEMLFEESKEIQQNTPENTPEEVMGSAETTSRIEENIIIDRVTTASIADPVVINKIARNAVIDTGAEVTVLSEKLYNQIPGSKRPKLRRAARNLEVAGAGENLTTEGITEVEVYLGSEIFKWPVYVAPIGDNMSLGCDLIDEMTVVRVGEKDTNSGLPSHLQRSGKKSNNEDVKFCCKNYEMKNGTCIECGEGFTSTNGAICQPCPEHTYGIRCRLQCSSCTENQTCHHISGCLSLKSATVNTISKGSTELIEWITTSDTKMKDIDNNESKNGSGPYDQVITIYSICIACFLVVVAICFICFKRLQRCKTEHGKKRTRQQNESQNAPNMFLNIQENMASLESIYHEID